jgi:hypothetical protein
MDTTRVIQIVIILAIGYVLGMKFPQWGAKIGL